jgi:hypothetical protein
MVGNGDGIRAAGESYNLYFPASRRFEHVVVEMGCHSPRAGASAANYKNLAKQVAIAGVIAIALVWAGYGFSAGRVRETMQLSARSMPSFQHFSAPLGRIGRDLILVDPTVPAPALIRGLATAWVLNKSQPPAYLFGRIKQGGWWYFFLVAVGVKSPIPFLLLVVAGLLPFRRLAKDGRWTAMAPAACALAILVVTMPVKYNVGTRHVLVVFPLLAIVGGYGCAYLWRLQGRLPGQLRPWGRAFLAALLIWQAISTARASSDYIAYFNELAGNDPARFWLKVVIWTAARISSLCPANFG